ncbi:MAG: DUF6713 family protein [Thermonemataceae bacterium]
MNVDFYTLGLSLIFMHEMDAIRCYEWRILPITSFLEDKTGMIVFIFLHVPLFYLLLLPSISQSVAFKTGFSIFLIIHFFLHLLFLFHKKNAFRDWVSWSIITGAGICGALYLQLTL